jgi:hypothetical protein
MQEFNWFSPLLQECGDDMKGLEINTYMTGELDLVRTYRHTSLGTHFCISRVQSKTRPFEGRRRPLC